MEDADLARLCQKGDMGAFEELFNKHQKQVFHISYRMTNNREDASDLTQEIFLRAYQKIGKFDSRSSFSTWLYKLAVNLCIDELRKRKKSANVLPLEEALANADPDTPENLAILNDRERQVWEALDSLKEKERAIIILKDIEGLSYDEIAKVFKCSLGRVKSRIHEARQKLKSVLEKKDELWTDFEGV
ncbi:sigma-70 family RNA polymerase sigma factor [Candidatus Poribacteria bacterium]|nr:sigma-70 family RNA polymerase sigma factor [Candidatus Poribacteria bacterium]